MVHPLPLFPSVSICAICGSILLLPPPSSARGLYPRHLVEESQDLGEDLRLGFHLEAARAGSPGLVASQLVARGGRDVAVVAVGQLDGERGPERALPLDGQAG